MKIKYREHLDIVFLLIVTLFGVYTNTFLNLISKYPDPYKLRQKSKKQLTNFFQKLMTVDYLKHKDSQYWLRNISKM